MSVEMNNKISMKPGFGKKLQTPTFNKPSFSSTRGADSSVFSKTNSLKSSVSQNISTTSLNRSFSAGYANSGSSVFGHRSANFVPGNHFLGVNDYYHNRNDLRNGINTNSIGYDPQTKGYRSGKHDLELMTGGWTQRSERRAFQRMGMVDLSTLQEPSNSGGKKKMSLLAKIGIGLGVGALAVGGGFAIANLIKKNKAEKSQDNESDMAKLNQLAQNQSNGDGKVKAQNKQTTKVDTKVQVQNKPTVNASSGGNTKLQEDSRYINLQNQQNELNSQLNQNESVLQQTNSRISQSKQNESTSLMALNAAKSQVAMLEGQLANSSLSDIQKQSIEASLDKAKDVVAQKQEQYDNAVTNTQILESDLQSLQNEKTTIQNNIDEVDNKISELTTTFEKEQAAQKEEKQENKPKEA